MVEQFCFDAEAEYSHMRDDLIKHQKAFKHQLSKYIICFVIGLFLFVGGCVFCFLKKIIGIRLFVIIFLFLLPAIWAYWNISDLLRRIRDLDMFIAFSNDMAETAAKNKNAEDVRSDGL